MWRLLEAQQKGCLRRCLSIEANAETTKLAERLASRELLPDIAAMIRENADRLRRVMRGLTVDQIRILRRHGIDDRSFKEIGAEFGHSASWAYGIWEAAAAEVRRRLMRPYRPRRRRAALAIKHDAIGLIDKGRCEFIVSADGCCLTRGSLEGPLLSSPFIAL